MVKEITTHVQTLGITCLSAVRQVEPCSAPSHDACKGLLISLDLLPKAIGQPSASGREPARPLRTFSKIDRHQFGGIPDRQCTQPDGIDQLKDSAIRPDAK